MTLITKDPLLAAKSLKEGHVVALPTETVYGLAASIYNEKALKEIFRLKKRPSDNPLIVHVKDCEMASRIAHVTEDFKKLFHAFMPGPLTVILEKKQISDIVTRGQETVAIRVPKHPLFQDVINLLNEPLAAPSANLSGHPSSTDAEHVYHDFSPELSLILDGGAATCGIESTIIQVFEDHGVILRPGVISQDALEMCLKKPFRYEKSPIKIVVPGMKYRHYAPKAKVILVEDESEIPLLNQEVMVMATKKIKASCFEMLSEDNLYRAFRKADQMGLKMIYVVMSSNLSEGLKNRLEKSAEKTS